MVLASCASTPPFVAGPHLTQTAADELPAPPTVDPSTGLQPYTIGPYDTLAVSVFGIPDLTRRLQVDSGGNFSLPLVGTIEAAGRTPSEVEAEIARRLRGQYVRDPKVAINPEETVSQVVTVEGQVREPGMYPAMGKMTLMRAVASARGATEFAKLQDVVIFRKIGDQEMAALYNLEGIRRGYYEDPRVYANDIVVVGDSPARRMFQQLLQVGSLVVSPLIAVLQR